MGANNILDTKIYYTAADSTSYFANLTAAQKENYKHIALVDLFLYVPAYTALLYLISKRFLPGKFVLFSFLPAVFDVTETGLIFLYLNDFISVFPGWTGVVTSLKWISSILLVIANCRQLYKKISAQCGQKKGPNAGPIS